MEPTSFEEYFRSMKEREFGNYIFDVLKPRALFDLAKYFPAYEVIEGSWFRAYNLIERHLKVAYFHSTVLSNRYSVSDTQWELYPSPQTGR